MKKRIKEEIKENWKRHWIYKIFKKLKGGKNENTYKQKKT